MTSEQNKGMVRRFYEAFEANDIAALNEVLGPDLVAYSPHTPDPQNRQAHVEGIEMWNAAFSDTYFTVEEQVAEVDRVATRVTLRATHSRGDFQGLPPTDKQVVMGGISIERIRDGKIIERRVNSDWLGLMLQLGLVSLAQPAR
jgi:predicted ester cyclase